MHLACAAYLDYGAAAGEGAKELRNINLAACLKKQHTVMNRYCGFHDLCVFHNLKIEDPYALA